MNGIKPLTELIPGLFVGKFYLDADAVPESLSSLLSPESLESLSQVYQTCFDLNVNELYFHPPSWTYLVATDASFKHIVTAATFTQSLVEVPRYLRNPFATHSFFVFNVGTDPSHRGRGYVKKLIPWAIQDLIKTHGQPDDYTNVYLLVHTTSPAGKLYRHLEFKTIGQVDKPPGLHDIMVWSSPIC